MLDEQSGESKSKKQNMNAGWSSEQNILNKEGTGDLDFKSERGHNDKGGASRFFYCAKASRSERNDSLDEFEEQDMNMYADEEGVMGMGGASLKDVDGQLTLADKSLRGGHKKVQHKKNIHPTVKPIKLMEYLIKLVSKKGAVVLDPFLGSGTTLIACAKLGRKGIGIEKESEYIEIAKARIKPYLSQKTLNEIGTKTYL